MSLKSRKRKPKASGMIYSLGRELKLGGCQWIMTKHIFWCRGLVCIGEELRQKTPCTSGSPNYLNLRIRKVLL